MRKTISPVLIVLAVLITSCHVSLKPNKGPESAQPTVAAGGPPAPPVVMVPKEAIASRAGQPVVFEVTGEGKVRQRAVKLGSARQDQQIVQQGLVGGETLVSRPSDALRDGDAVKVKS